MQDQSRPRLSSEQRQSLIDRISQHLNDQDDETLVLMADLAPGTFSPQVTSVSDRSLTRRRFLTAALTSGFFAATTGAVAVWEYGNGRGHELSADLDTTKLEMTHVWGLVHLYEKLDQAGLDQVVATGLAAVGTGLEALAVVGDAVKAGVQIARDSLIKLDTALPAIRASITWLEGLVEDWAQRIHLLEDAIGRAMNEVSPITQALGGIFNSIVTALPLGAGTKIKEVLDRTGEIITLIPRAIADINVKVLTPFRDEWLSDDAKGLKGWLIDPVITKLLDPLETLLNQLNDLTRDWEANLTVPAKAIMNRRETIRQEIADYKTQYHLQEPQSDAAS